MKKILASIIASLFLSCCGTPSANTVNVKWDEYGIPHIEADNLQALYYGLGRAQAYNHGKLMLKNYAKGNGMLARFEGVRGLENDLLLNRIGLLSSSVSSKAQEDPQVYAALEQFVRGINDELVNHKEKLGEYAVMLPITVDHVINFTKYDLYIAFAMRRELSEKWPRVENVASTAVSYTHLTLPTTPYV